MDLTDEPWEVLKPMIPAPPRRANGRGRPWRPHRIIAHVKLCVLALRLERAAEIRCQHTWRTIRQTLDQLKVVRYRLQGKTIVQSPQVTSPMADPAKSRYSLTEEDSGGVRRGKHRPAAIETCVPDPLCILLIDRHVLICVPSYRKLRPSRSPLGTCAARGAA
jgi:hypothetical protein